ncbi:MAG: NUDIX hydrolase [Anaerolineales bacterium]|nr:NUDIX hydrolase [Anaerolineales bacterium]
MPFETIYSETVYHGKAFDVRRDRVRLPDNQVADLDIIDHSGAVTILPLDDQGRVWFVRQYRHATGEMLLELPAGTLEKDEEPQVCALREIREEIGMSARKIQKLGEFYLAPGYSTEYMHIFLATDLQPDPLPGDVDEFLSVEQIPIQEALAMAHSGMLRDGKTLAALFLLNK